MNYRLYIVSAIILVIFSGCTGNDKVANNLNTVVISPTSGTSAIEQEIILSPGKASAKGQIHNSFEGSNSSAELEIRLATVHWNDDKTEGAFVIDESASPVTTTDDSGAYLFQAIAPGDYVMVVGDLYGTHVIVSEPDGKAKIFSLKEDEITDLGVISVDLNVDLNEDVIKSYPAPDDNLPAPAYP